MTEEAKTTQIVDANAKWYQVNPLDCPKVPLAAMPKHTPERFQDYTEIVQGGETEDKKVIGFELQDKSKFFFDKTGGWIDENGCYYNKDGDPEGWMVVTKKEGQTHEHFYDSFGQYVPSDAEEESQGDESDSQEDFGLQGEANLVNQDDSIEDDIEEYADPVKDHVDDYPSQEEDDQKELKQEDQQELKQEENPVVEPKTEEEIKPCEETKG